MRRPLRMRDLPKRDRTAWDAIGQGAPELLQDADFEKLKAKAEPRKNGKPEKKLVQRPLVVHLRRHLPAGSIVHAQAIEPISENHRFAMQRDGVQFGMPDLDVYVPGAFVRGWSALFWLGKIECKRPDGGSLSASQIQTQALLIELGVPVLSECRSVEQAVDWLRQQGVQI